MNGDYDYTWEAWEDEPREDNQVICDNPDIYRMNIKEMNQLIYNKLEEILSLLSRLV